MVRNSSRLGLEKNILTYLYSPGRFFAVAELKVLLAYIICNYDFKIDGGERPPSKFFSYSCSPDFSAELLFRVRVDAGESFINKGMGIRH